MLSGRATLLVWLSGGVALTLSGIVFLGRTGDQIAAVATSLSNAESLMINGVSTLIMGAIAAIGVSSLVRKLSESLHVAELALAERDQAYMLLEQRVAERTSELQQALAALQTSEAKYRTLFEILPIGVIVADEQGQYSEYNQIARDILELDRADTQVHQADHPAAQVISPEGSVLPLSAYLSVQTLRDRPPITGLELGVIRSTSASSEVTWLRVNVALLDLAHAGAVIVFSDITTRKLAEQALAHRAAHLRALRDALPDLLFIVSADGVFLEYHVPSQSELLLPPEKFLEQPLEAVLPPDIVEMAYLAIERVLASGAIETFEYTLALSDGNQTFEARVVPITSDEILVVVRNITERRLAMHELLRAKEAAESADRAKSTFLAHISHEFRTPLTAIIGMSDLLNQSDLSPHQRTYASTMRASAETLLHLISNILDFSKIEAGRIDIARQPFDLHACVSDALSLILHDAEQKGLKLEWSVDAAAPRMLIGDEVRLRQVLVNLLDNSVKFTDQGAVCLCVSGRALTDETYHLTISVNDTGIGITPDELPLIFDPFVQADGAVMRRFDGTGLGLTISKQLTELMGGQISVTSHPGVGSTFTVVLPLQIAPIDGSAPPLIPATHTALSRRPLHILLAEDNPTNQVVLCQMLRHLGYTPDVAANGEAAVAAVSSQPYDLVLMDIQMPGLDGAAATQRIRALPGIKQPYIIALTASALSGDRERYLAVGMDDYLCKPLQLADLRNVLERRMLYNDQPPAASSLPASLGVSLLDSEHSDSLVDWSMLNQLLETIGGTPAQASTTILELFRDVLSEQMAELADAVAAADRPLIRSLAHKLRGGGRQLGAVALSVYCGRIEAAAQRDDEEINEVFELARHAYTATLESLTERLAGVQPPQE